jgi:hypothetical protein
VEICGNSVCREAATQTISLAACSACAGDYEDPDRSAWSENDLDGDDDDSEHDGAKVSGE